MIKCFQSEHAEITCLNFGPFDNGHIVLGFNTGHILILSSFDMASLYRMQVFESVGNFAPPIPVTKIVFDPLQTVIAASSSLENDGTQSQAASALADNLQSVSLRQQKFGDDKSPLPSRSLDM